MSDALVSVVHLPTWEVRDDLPEDVYEQERLALGEMFESEYAARFLGSGNALLSEGEINSCIRAGGELDPAEVSDAVVGFDLGLRRDPSAAVVVGRMAHCGKLTVAAIVTWAPPVDLSGGTWAHAQNVLQEVAIAARMFGNADVICDTFEAQTVKAQLQRFGAHCRQVSMGEHKWDVHRELARLIRSGLISYPEHPELIADLRRLRVSYGSKRPTITNPRGGGRHGDVGQALAVTMQVWAEEGSEVAYGAVSLPTGGWSDSVNGSPDSTGGDPKVGSREYWELPPERRREVALAAAGGGNGPGFVLHPPTKNDGEPAWLASPTTGRYDD